MGAITQEEFDAKKTELLSVAFNEKDLTNPAVPSSTSDSLTQQKSKMAAPPITSDTVTQNNNTDTSSAFIGIGCLTMLCFPVTVILQMCGAYDISIFFLIPSVIGVLLFLFGFICSTAETLSTPEGRKELKENFDRDKFNGYKYTCPMCGSNRIKTIGAGKKVAGALTIGLLEKYRKELSVQRLPVQMVTCRNKTPQISIQSSTVSACSAIAIVFQQKGLSAKSRTH